MYNIDTMDFIIELIFANQDEEWELGEFEYKASYNRNFTYNDYMKHFTTNNYTRIAEALKEQGLERFADNIDRENFTIYDLDQANLEDIFPRKSSTHHIILGVSLGGALI